jgi:hypothetical protein
LAKAMVGSRAGHVYEAVGERQLKGLADPVVVFALASRPRSRRSVPLPDGCASANRGPLAGRVAERATLRMMWNEAMSGQRRLVLVSGEPRVGKTRLAVDLACDAYESDGAVVLFGRCDVRGSIWRKESVKMAGIHERLYGRSADLQQNRTR